jgi:hypothetical protein
MANQHVGTVDFKVKPSSQVPANLKSQSSNNLALSRKCHSSDIKSEVSRRPKLDLPKIAYCRSAYNRMIGETVRMELDGHCEDLPDLAALGYTPEIMTFIFGSSVQ